MERRSLTVPAIAGALLVGAALAGAATSAQRYTPVEVRGATPQVRPASLDPSRQATVMVQVDGAPVAVEEGRAERRGEAFPASRRAAVRAALRGRQDALLAPIGASGAEVLGQYQDAYNGIKVRVALSDVPRLAALPGVTGVRRLQTFRPTNDRGIPYVGANAAWADLGRTGKGVRVAVIDTGIDYYHANFNGSGDPADFEADDGLSVPVPLTDLTGGKVAAGYDFVGDDYDASADPGSPALVPQPDPDPLDCDGHGSHVAGTAAGAGVLADGGTFAGPYDATTYTANSFGIGPGSAPEATVYAYRVFGCVGSTDIVVDAIDRAVRDGVDVINMSLGADFGNADDPTTVAVDNASAAGIVVVASAGNAGPGAYITGTPASAESAISVAAMDATPEFRSAQVAGDALTPPLAAINANESDALPVTGTLRVLRDAAGGIALGCEDAEYAPVQPGDIVVTVRGVCARTDRAVQAEAAGAAAAVMVNTDEGLPPLEGPIPGVTIPFLGVPSTAADALSSADGTTVTLSDTGVIANPGFRLLAPFTSAGPRSRDSAPKPDVTAPGVSVKSTGVGQGTGSARISGTSMSSPLVAGVAALVVEAHPDWTPEQVKAAIMNTADPAGVTDQDVRISGSGVVNARSAVGALATATTGPGTASLAFGYEPLAGAYSETLPVTIANGSAGPVTYDLAVAAESASLGVVPSVSPAQVTVGPGQGATVQVTLALDAAGVAALPPALGPPGSVVTVSGALTATPTAAAAGITALRVPFLLAPRGTSAISSSARTRIARRLQIETTLRLRNDGVHAGTADVYAWGLLDPDDVGTPNDVRAVGVQSLPGEVAGLDPSDRLLVFAVSGHDRWSSPSENEFDIPIDTRGNRDPEFVLVGVDLGAVLAGAFNGELGSFLFDAEGNLVAAFNAVAGSDSSTLLLPVPASALGLTPRRGDLQYGITGFSLLDQETEVDEVRGRGRFDAYAPALSQGDFVELAPGARATLALTGDLRRLARNPALGWLVVSQDDGDGAPQADLVPVIGR